MDEWDVSSKRGGGRTERPLRVVCVEFDCDGDETVNIVVAAVVDDGHRRRINK